MKRAVLTMVIGLGLFGAPLGEIGAAQAAPDCSQIYHLRGLDPIKSAQRRRPGLEAASELRRAVRAGCGSQVLALAKDPHRYETVNGQTLDVEQRAVLKRGLLAALGDVPGEEAARLLWNAARDEALDVPTRRKAAEALGRPDQAWVVDALADLATAWRSQLELSTSALVGLGRTADPRAVEILSEEIRNASAPAKKRAAISALGSLAIRAEGKPEQAQVRSLALSALVEALYAADLQPVADDVIENLVAARAIESIRALESHGPVEIQAPHRALERLRTLHR